MGLRMCRKRVSSALIPLIFSSRALLIYVGFAWNANVLVLHSIDGNHCNLFEVSDNSARLLVFCLEQGAMPGKLQPYRLNQRGLPEKCRRIGDGHPTTKVEIALCECLFK
jgi:hypothetical protein